MPEMPFDPFQYIAKLERKSPKLAHAAVMGFLSWLSPFNAHLKARMVEWTDRRSVINLRRIRRVRNHVGSIHAGALFTLGETCAGLVIVRNFPFEKYRPLMSDVKVTYSRQARGDVIGEAEIASEEIRRMLSVIASGEVPFTEVTTTIRNGEGDIVATVVTSWQVKQWDLVRNSSA